VGGSGELAEFQVSREAWRSRAPRVWEPTWQLWQDSRQLKTQATVVVTGLESWCWVQ
jgi:hypothetical protein